MYGAGHELHAHDPHRRVHAAAAACRTSHGWIRASTSPPGRCTSPCCSSYCYHSSSGSWSGGDTLKAPCKVATWLGPLSVMFLVIHIALMFATYWDYFIHEFGTGDIAFTIGFGLVGLLIGWILSPPYILSPMRALLSPALRTKLAAEIGTAQKGSQMLICSLIFAFGRYPVAGVMALASSVVTILIILWFSPAMGNRQAKHLAAAAGPASACTSGLRVRGIATVAACPSSPAVAAPPHRQLHATSKGPPHERRNSRTSSSSSGTTWDGVRWVATEAASCVAHRRRGSTPWPLTGLRLLEFQCRGSVHAEPLGAADRAPPATLGHGDGTDHRRRRRPHAVGDHQRQGAFATRATRPGCGASGTWAATLKPAARSTSVSTRQCGHRGRQTRSSGRSSRTSPRARSPRPPTRATPRSRSTTSRSSRGRRARSTRSIATYDLDFRIGFDRKITEWACDFMTRSKDAGKPFYTYLPYTQVHIPPVPDPEFAGKTKRGNFADLLVQMDAFTGQILDKLDELGHRRGHHRGLGVGQRTGLHLPLPLDRPRSRRRPVERLVGAVARWVLHLARRLEPGAVHRALAGQGAQGQGQQRAGSRHRHLHHPGDGGRRRRYRPTARSTAWTWLTSCSARPRSQVGTPSCASRAIGCRR